MYIYYIYICACVACVINHSSTCVTQIDTNSPFYRSGPPARSPAVPFAEQLPAGAMTSGMFRTMKRNRGMSSYVEITHVVCFFPENLENFGKTPNPLPLSPSPSRRSVRLEGEQLAPSKPRMQPNPLVNHVFASKTAITCGPIRHFQAQQVAASFLLTGAHSSFIS